MPVLSLHKFGCLFKENNLAIFSVNKCFECDLIFQKNILNKKYSEKFYDEYIDINFDTLKNQN